MKFLSYERLMRFGRSSGCHQMPERSFFIKGKQFPICARCTGVLIGNIGAYIMFFIHILPWEIYALGCAVMFLDWYVQYIGMHQSTNIRRLITGMAGGFSLATFYCMAIKHALGFLLP